MISHLKAELRSWLRPCSLTLTSEKYLVMTAMNARSYSHLITELSERFSLIYYELLNFILQFIKSHEHVPMTQPSHFSDKLENEDESEDHSLIP